MQGFHYPPRIAATGTARLKVGVLLGCVQRVFFDNINAATIRVLAAEGCEMFIPPEQGCCGALATHVGREEQSLESARNLIDTFAGQDSDYIVVNAAGCGSNVKEYGYLLRDDPSMRRRRVPSPRSAGIFPRFLLCLRRKRSAMRFLLAPRSTIPVICFMRKNSRRPPRAC